MKKNLLLMILSILTSLTGNSFTAMAQEPETEAVSIATAEDLFTFAQAVENGTQVNGVLTADIDLSASDYPDLMIGTDGKPFTGTFDGQGHSITYYYEGKCVADKWRGLFRAVDGATIRNLRVEGEAFPTNIHFGALIGVAYGTVLVENVMTNVHITGMRSGVTGDAGMLGANYANITFNNCATLGEMGNEGSSMYSSYSGWSNGSSSTTLNNCYTACTFTEGTGTDHCFTLTHGSGKNTFNNCYYLNVIGTEQGIPITEEQMASGALCYKLNGDQTSINWTQTLGTDQMPQAGTASQRVYASGTVRCDGTELEDNPLTYTNTETYPNKPVHQFDKDGICIVCGTADPDAVKQNAEGYYLIGNPKQLSWLALRIEQGEMNAKVLLTDDIDINNCDDPDLMIATEASPFRGIFDGAGHTISYSYAYIPDKWRGLFRAVDGATIRNLRVEGEALPTNIHFGALIGVAYGDVLVENVITNVQITGLHSGVTGDAGMLGANYANITFNNCATLGEMGNPGSCMYSSYSGWSDGNSQTTLNNCYTSCQLSEGTGNDYCFTMTHPNGTVTLNNCYYLNQIGTKQATQVTAEQIENGALCYMLNGDQSQINWYQTLGEDELPVPDATHLKVYGAGNTFMNITDDASFKAFVSLVIENEKEFYEETKTQKSLLTSYFEALEALRTSADIETFIAAYNQLDGQRQIINSCATAYAAYMAKVEETKKYLEEHTDLDNEKIDALKVYLNEYNEPNEDYPNGSALTILDKCTLSEEEIIAETAYIATKLAEAITYTPAAGTDITLLFTNADLSDKFNGWEGELPTGWGTSETSQLYAAECLGKTMDMYQTVTGLKNGIYELRINGAFRPTPYDDFYNTNYAATLYANGIHNYFQTNIEDMISVDEAIDGENCNINGPIADFAITDADGETIGYTMQGIVSCCNAFQAGRYPNSVLCKVTDGILTIGIRQPGTGLSRDWLGFGNIKVFYYGQIDDAGESLDHVLASQAARAYTILNDYEFDYMDDYAIYPNFSQALKDELQQTMDAVKTTTEPEAKYKLVEKFSSLFLQIYECKQAYIVLKQKADEVNSMLNALYDLLTNEEYNQMDDYYMLLDEAYGYGSMSAEEVWAIDLKKEFNFYPEEEDGNYLLRSTKDFLVYGSLVNAGAAKLDAKLCTDIDLSESELPYLMIGTEENPFRNIFDGQGHTITYNYEEIPDKWSGLFASVDGATIRNLRVEGEAYPSNIHYGALIGVAYGDVLVENVITNVHITGMRSGVTGDAGMLGANYANITFNNCATLGEMGNEGSSMYSSYSGWSNGDSHTTLNNCYTACTFTEGTGTDHCFTLTHAGGPVTINNCYYLNQIGTAQGTKMTLEQFKNGEVCYKLNGDQSIISWYQNIGEDELPVLDNSHKTVIYDPVNGYQNSTQDDEDGISISEELRVKSEEFDNAVYDLSGRKVVNGSGLENNAQCSKLNVQLKKGLYIVNGKKVLY